MKQIALIKTGCTVEQIKPRHGDFEDWFADGLGVSGLLQIDVFRNEPLPVPKSLAGVVITGSPAMVSARLDWSERTAQWLKRAVQANIKVLGVCYGHQLLAHALGGIAGPNPAGRQIGTVCSQAIDNIDNDSLMGHFPKSFSAQTSHSEVVLKLPPGAQRLATSPLDNNFAIRFAKNAWGVQFHPEFSPAVTSDYVHYRSGALIEEGLDPEQLMRGVKETEVANSILKKFAELVKKQK